MRTRTWIALGTTLAVQALALPARAGSDGLYEAVKTCNEALEPYAGVTLTASSRADELAVDVAPFAWLTQVVGLQAVDPPEPDRTIDPPEPDRTIDPPEPDRTIDPPEPDLPASLVAVVEPGSTELTASFDAGSGRTVPLTVVAGPGSAVDAAFGEGPDAPGPVHVALDASGADLRVDLIDPPEPDRTLTVVVDTASVKSLVIVDSAGRRLQLTYVR